MINMIKWIPKLKGTQIEEFTLERDQIPIGRVRRMKSSLPF